MNRIDGRSLRSSLDLETDIVIVGSGPAGSAAAREASRLGARVIVVEEGRFFDPSEFPESSFASMAAAYRDMGASVVFGPAPIPFVQGKMVGGSSPINGAICWRMPRDIYDAWIQADPALADGLWQAAGCAFDDGFAPVVVAPLFAAGHHAPTLLGVVVGVEVGGLGIFALVMLGHQQPSLHVIRIVGLAIVLQATPGVVGVGPVQP